MQNNPQQGKFISSQEFLAVMQLVGIYLLSLLICWLLFGAVAGAYLSLGLTLLVAPRITQRLYGNDVAIYINLSTRLALLTLTALCFWGILFWLTADNFGEISVWITLKAVTIATLIVWLFYAPFIFLTNGYLVTVRRFKAGQSLMSPWLLLSVALTVGYGVFVYYFSEHPVQDHLEQLQRAIVIFGGPAFISSYFLGKNAAGKTETNYVKIKNVDLLENSLLWGILLLLTFLALGLFALAAGHVRVYAYGLVAGPLIITIVCLFLRPSQIVGYRDAVVRLLPSTLIRGYSAPRAWVIYLLVALPLLTGTIAVVRPAIQAPLKYNRAPHLTVAQAEELLALHHTTYVDGLEVLGPDVARVIARSREDLNFPRLQELSPGAAIELAKHRRSIEFGALRTISPETAIALGGHQVEQDVFDGLTLPLLSELSPAAARGLAQSHGQLNFYELRSITPAVAAGLAEHVGPLRLVNLQVIDDEVALALSHHRGDLTIPSVTTISDTGLSLLARHDGEIVLGNAPMERRFNKYRPQE